MKKTLSEVCEITGLHRRVIQEYEKKNIAFHPSERNKYGHLLYNDDEIRRLLMIKFYRELDFSNKQIEEIFSSESFNELDALTQQIELLKEKQKKLEETIQKAKSLRASLFSLDTNSFNLLGNSSENLYMINLMTNSVVKNSAISSDNYLDEEEKILPVKIFLDFITEFRKTRRDVFKALDNQIENKVDPTSKEVQNNIDIIYNAFSDKYCDSLICNRLFYYHFTSPLEDYFNNSSHSKILLFENEAISYYLQNREMQELDRKILEFFSYTAEFLIGKKEADSVEVQNAMHDLMNIFSEIKYITPNALKYFTDTFFLTYTQENMQNLAFSEDIIEYFLFLKSALKIFLDKQNNEREGNK